MPCRLTNAASATAAIALGLALVFSPLQAKAQTTGDYLTGGKLLPAKAPSVSRGGPTGPAPAAVPGAQSNQDRVTPATQPTAEMSPNDALFDAINRGDIADARDAINRGANLDSRNILGLTPIDLSVDLSRNDITMLLLSMRGAVSSSPAGPPAKVASAGGKSAKPVPAPARMAAAKAPAADPAVRRQFVSTDPGTPAPQVGFLGFGGTPQP